MGRGLKLISIGLADEYDLSLRAIEEARSCDKLYVELYTTRLSTSRERLEEVLQRPLTELSRMDLEGERPRILEEASRSLIGLLIGGDCLAATTHISLLLEAKRQGIPTWVIHGSSIFTAIAETGLSLYKFGRIVTLPLPERGPPDTVLEALEGNLSLDLHTLILLDLDVERDRWLSVSEGVRFLLEADRPEVFNEETPAIGVARLGWSNPLIKGGRAVDLLDVDFGDPPQALIIPGRLHFMEEEGLRLLADCPGEALKGWRPRGEPEHLVERYMKSCRGVMEKLRDKPLSEEARRILDYAARYLSDAEYYAGEGRWPTALAAISYCEGLLDALRLLGLAEFEW
ncbi:diphthine synthase [Candidatus Bathyarchaeota archaeon]|nr:MAG: diphthine synthase [Candidatus Bathyarchaeota archaeon]